MRQLKLGICDHEQSYAMGLMTYMNADKRNTIFAMAFSSKEKLLAYLEDKNLDILLIAEKDRSDEDIIPAVKERQMCVLYLTEDKQTEDRTMLYRYESAANLVKQILQQFRATDTDIKQSELFTCCGVISPIGRSGKTEIAKSICLLDEVRGGLYIGMEAYGSIQDEPEDDENADYESKLPMRSRQNKDRYYTMGDLAYLIKLRSEQISEYIEQSIVKKDEIAEIASPESYLDLRELTAKDIRWFLKRLIGWGRYTTIVCDIDGSALSDLTILGEFDRIIVPYPCGEKGNIKRKAFERLLMKTDLQKVMERMQVVEVPDASFDTPEMLRIAGKLVEG